MSIHKPCLQSGSQICYFSEVFGYYSGVTIPPMLIHWLLLGDY